MVKLRHIIIDSDDELPDILAIARSNRRHEVTAQPEAPVSSPRRDGGRKPQNVMRRRKLGQLDGCSFLLGKGGPEMALSGRKQGGEDETEPPRRRPELQAARARKAASISHPGDASLDDQPACLRAAALDSPSDSRCANIFADNNSDETTPVASRPASSAMPAPSIGVRYPRDRGPRSPCEGGKKEARSGSLSCSSAEDAESQLRLAHP